MTDTLTSWGGWAPAIRDNPFGHFTQARAQCPVQKVRLADGKVITAGPIPTMLASEHPWVKSYFRGKRSRVDGARAA